MIRLIVSALFVISLATYFLWPDNRSGNQVEMDISTLLSDPRKYDGLDVVIKGKVNGNLSLFRVGGYIVEQNGKKMYVITKQGSPKDGEIVTVRGTFKQAMQFGTVEQSVVFER